MEICIKTVEKNEKIDVIRLFKSEENIFYMLTNIASKYILIELIAFNELVVVDEIDAFTAKQWTSAEKNECLYFNNIFFHPLNICDTEKYLNDEEYNIIFKQGGEFWEVENTEIEPDEISSSSSMPLEGMLIKMVLSKKNIVKGKDIDDYLDKIRIVGYDNLTKEEKKGLKELQT